MGKTFIIAEVGSNHNRDWDTALKHIDAAVEAGCDAVKFQTYNGDTLYSKNTPDFAGYSNINKLMNDIALPRDWQVKLKDYCDSVGIEFMSTPFDEAAVEQLVKIGVKRLKIAGFEGTDPRFVEMVASTGLPVIISAGIGFHTANNWGALSEIFDKYGNDVTLLHCNNAYPTPMEDVNIYNISVNSGLKSVNRMGFSDHTMSTLTPALAVARGAQVIEKHFTLDRTMEGPDHPFALEPDELKEMVKLIREAEKTQGFKAGYTESEKTFTKGMRSVVAVRDIKPGEVLTKDMLTTKRPCLDDSVSAVDYYNILGHTLVGAIKEDEILNKTNLPTYYESGTI